MRDTRGGEYTNRLLQRTSKRWKLWLNVQAPYRWNLRRRHLGATLDVGCGIGRNLVALDAGSIGVDHNPTSVAVAREAGLTALTVDEWQSRAHEHTEHFDSILIAHVIEHLGREDARQLIRNYLPALKRGGKVFMICPQERGYASDETHVTWTTGEHLIELAQECGLLPEECKSFPFPRPVGRWFVYNEFTVMATKPTTMP
jgi:2-polyprenyl-3-methyl-5-hydroxy-6-metoxy-1,4-benzoquinol methylase